MNHSLPHSRNGLLHLFAFILLAGLTLLTSCNSKPNEINSLQQQVWPGVAADGSAVNQSATLTYDGKDVAWTGSSAFDAVTLKKVNGTTVKAELKKDGKVVGHSVRTVSGKGKVLTLSSALKTGKGGTTHETGVYDKQ